MKQGKRVDTWSEIPCTHLKRDTFHATRNAIYTRNQSAVWHLKDIKESGTEFFSAHNLMLPSFCVVIT